jgi:hypothetical protein
VHAGREPGKRHADHEVAREYTDAATSPHRPEAGAAGTAVLNLITYGDMLVRGRPPSEVPAETAARMAGEVGVHLSGEEQPMKSRRTAAGALLGYGAGLGIGALYGVPEDAVPDLPLPLSGALVGAVAMAASDVPASATGATDPRRWGRTGWLADLIPHFAYGLATVAVYRTLRG